MNLAHHHARLLAAATLVASATTAHATFTTYTSQVGFASAAGFTLTDSFDSLASGELGTSMQRIIGSTSYRVSSPSGLYSIGSGDVWMSNDDRREAITFGSFSQPIRGLGASFFGTNESGTAIPDQLIRVTFTDATAATSSTLLSSNSSTSFFGVLSTSAIVSMTVAIDSSNLLAAWPTVNNLAIAPPVPEPTTYALVAMGLIGVVAAAKRRRNG